MLQLKDSKGFFAGEPKIVTVPIPGQGMHWEADETARALRDGKTESSVVTYGMLGFCQEQSSSAVECGMWHVGWLSTDCCCICITRRHFDGDADF